MKTEWFNYEDSDRRLGDVVGGMWIWQHSAYEHKLPLDGASFSQCASVR